MAKEHFNNMRTIQSLLHQYVQDYVSESFKNDKCKPVYIVSIYRKSLILTCRHNNVAFSTTLFPEKDMSYGVNLLKDVIDGLYNRTM